jgi:hypothetical protein
MVRWCGRAVLSGAVHVIAVRACAALPPVAAAQDLDLVNATLIGGGLR